MNLPRPGPGAWAVILTASALIVWAATAWRFSRPVAIAALVVCGISAAALVLALLRRRWLRWMLLAAIVLVVAAALHVGRTRSLDAARPVHLALAAIEVGEWELALEHLRAAQRLEPGSPRILQLLGLTSATAGGRDVVAIAWLRAYLAAEPRAPDEPQVRRQIQRLEARAGATLDELRRRTGASAPTNAPDSAARADRGQGEVAAWIRVLNDRLLGRPALENLPAFLARLEEQGADTRRRAMTSAAEDLAAGLRAVRETEAAWKAAREQTVVR